jgi:S-adenosylmethionine-diacylglycerol 3-amino-3-carboxypropyl transferase
MTKTAARPSTTAHLRRAVHHHKLASRRGVLERLFTLWFRGFVYNQIWEDPRVDAEALRIGPETSLLTISSGGCNVLNYLVHRPKRIVAIDLNHNHMSLTRLKLAAVRHLPDYESFYNFFGYGRHRDNVANYRRYIRDQLDAETRGYWESTDWPGRSIGPKRIGYFSRGLYDRSKLGQFFRVVHGIAKGMRRDPARLLTARTLAEQERIFDESYGPLFENGIVRWMGRQPVAVYSLGIPPSQHQAMLEEQGNDGGRLFDMYKERIRRLACGFPLDDNYFAWQAFGRRYDHDGRRALPDYLKPEHYETIKAMAPRVETHMASLADQLAREQPGSLNGFILLDSQDWMPPAVIDDLWRHIARVGGPGTRVIFRTAGERSPVETALGPDLKPRFAYREERSRELHRQDRSAIYGMFHLYEMLDGEMLDGEMLDGPAAGNPAA